MLVERNQALLPEYSLALGQSSSLGLEAWQKIWQRSTEPGQFSQILPVISVVKRVWGFVEDL
jgi:hypothetical protein